MSDIEDGKPDNKEEFVKGSSRDRSKSRSRSRSATPERKSRSRSRSRSRDRKKRSRSRTYSPVRRDSTGRTVVNGRIHVSDFPASLSKRDLERAFERHGKIVDLWMATYPPYYAFITYKHNEDAEKAIRKMNDEYVGGSRVRVAHALPKREAPSRWGRNSYGGNRYNDRGGNDRYNDRNNDRYNDRYSGSRR